MNKTLYVCEDCGQTIFVKRKPKKCHNCGYIFTKTFYKLETIVLK